MNKMKKILKGLFTLGASFILLCNIALASGSETNGQGEVTTLFKGVQLIKQSAVKIQAEKTIYVDPFMLDTEVHDADVIFITHTHSDHFSPKDINLIKKDSTILVIPSEGVEKAKAAGFSNIVAVEPNQSYTADSLCFTTVPAYNLDKTFHPKEKNWVGYVIAINNATYYFAGDIDAIPELKDVHADVFFLPIGGKFTMNAQEAAQAANTIKPRVVVPYHCGDLKGVGSQDDIINFLTSLDNDVLGVALK